MNQNNQTNIKIHQKNAYGAGGRPWALDPGLGAGGLGAGARASPFIHIYNIIYIIYYTLYIIYHIIYYMLYVLYV